MGGEGSGRKPDILKQLQRQNVAAQMHGEEFILPNHSGDHVRGMVRETPVNDTDIANKAYVDNTLHSKIVDDDGDTLVDTEETADKDEIVFRCAGEEIGRFMLTTSPRLKLTSTNNNAMETCLFIYNPNNDGSSGTGLAITNYGGTLASLTAQENSGSGNCTLGVVKAPRNMNPTERNIFIEPNAVQVNSLILGSFYTHNDAVVLNNVNPAQFYDWLGNFTSGILNKMTFRNNYELLVEVAGWYKIDWGQSVYITAGDYTAPTHIQGSVSVNGNALPDCVGTESIYQAEDIKHIGGICYYLLAVGDVVRLCAANMLTADNVTLEDANITCLRVGQPP